MRNTRKKYEVVSLIVLGLAILIACGNQAYPQGGTWTTKTPMPTTRSYLAVAAINNVIYAVGGGNSGNGNNLSTVEAYDPTTNIWTTKASMQQPRDELRAAVINGIMYAIGGWQSPNQLAIVEAYDPSTNVWTFKAPMPAARTDMGAGAVNGILYAVGGFDRYGAGILSRVDAYDPSTNTWSTKSPLPSPRNNMGIGVINGILYAVGGGDNTGALATMVAYNPVTDTWTPKAAMPTARYGFAVGVINGILYAVGGDNASGHLNTVEAYEPAADHWTSLAGMPTARVGLAGDVVNGILYAVGGYGGSILATNEAFSPPPPLRETLLASDGCSGTASLTYGLDPSATDGLDVSLGEYELPPPPPSGVFDLRFVLPVVPAIASPVDIRSDTSQSATWRLTFQPGSCGYPLTFSWDSTAFPATGSFTLTDEVGGTVVKLNMRGQQKYVLSNTSITSLRIVYKTSISRDVALGAGWNLVSVPVRAADSSVSTLYPGASSQAYGYQNAYVAVTTFSPGNGYWLKFNAGQTSTVNGSQVNPPDVAVATGWNLMGPFETDVATNAITSTPPGIVTANYFGYNGGYQFATTLGMGKGYWVKVSQAGMLHLPWGLGRVGVRPVVAQVSESGVSLKLSDAAGLSGALSLMKAGDLKGSSDLPPLPPSGIFDVRFGSNTSREALTGTGGVHDIRLSGALLPVQLVVTGLSGHQMQVVDGLSGGKLLREVITEGRVITLGHGVLTESGSGSILIQEMNDLPVAFELGQNYPNPFNPTSVISFALPEASQVNLDLYSILGQKVLSLANGEYPAGNHTVELNAQSLASGTYFYRIQAGKYNAIKKLMVLK